VKEAVLFDLGNTLVRYWRSAEFSALLDRALAGVSEELAREGLLHVAPGEIGKRVQQENHESPDHRVRPLEGRLTRVFGMEGSACSDVRLAALCRRFLAPMLGCGQIYADTLPTLDALRAHGLRTAIVSNMPWGSPTAPWREELTRLGLRERIDLTVFCHDVGWRKPARQIFEFTLSGLQVAAERCLFVGDHPEWDVAGARAAGMDAVRIDRWAPAAHGEEKGIHSLNELWGVLGL
jgi:putative hydrolase of the HAD superfamily